MNAKFKAWLLSHGFRRAGTSCLFSRMLGDNKALVWLHRNGGQAQINTHYGVGKRLARLESWKSIEELQEFFGKELEK